jgi:hypothetical protein
MVQELRQRVFAHRSRNSRCHRSAEIQFCRRARKLHMWLCSGRLTQRRRAKKTAPPPGEAEGLRSRPYHCRSVVQGMRRLAVPGIPGGRSWLGTAACRRGVRHVQSELTVRGGPTQRGEQGSRGGKENRRVGRRWAGSKMDWSKIGRAEGQKVKALPMAMS